MKALLLKDWYVLWKQMKILLLFILVMCLVNTTFNSVFIVIWCSMLPYTAMAYDNRSHWDQLAAMMPYSQRDMVLSKYVLGWLCMAAAGLLSLAMQTVIGCFLSGTTSDVSILLAALCLGMISLAITLPLILRFGVERGRMVFLLVFFLIAAGAGIVLDASNLPPIVLPLPAEILLPLAAILTTAVSIPLSLRLYRSNS